jgi:hypothetical protein
MRAERGGELLMPRRVTGKQQQAVGGGAAAQSGHGGAERQDPIVVRGRPALRELQGQLLSKDRRQPIVALARSLESNEPVLAASDVRAIVGPEPALYFIGGEYLLRILQGALGRQLALHRGSARIWWPDLSRRSDPSDHPLVLELDGEPHGHMLAEFAREFDLSRPRVRREIKQVEDIRRMAEHELSDVRAQLTKTEERLRDAHVERHSEATRADTAELRAQAASRELASMNAEERMHTLICREWIAALSASERRKHPLRAYVLHAQLLAEVQRRADVAEESVAWACAMVACGLGSAKAGAAGVHYATGADGTLEFVGIGEQAAGG